MSRQSMENMQICVTPSSIDSDISVTTTSSASSLASNAAKNQLRSTSESPTILATMTPVNLMDLKKEMDENHSSVNKEPYENIKSELPNDKECDSSQYQETTEDKQQQQQQHQHQQQQQQQQQSHQQHQPPIDLIFEDENRTVIYTTAFDQKSLEIITQEHNPKTNGGVGNDGTVGGVVGAGSRDETRQANVHNALDAKHGAVTNATAEMSVPVVFQDSNHHGFLQYPQTQVPTVLVLSEMTCDDGVSLIGIRKRKDHSNVDHTSCNGVNDLPVVVQRGMADMTEGATHADDLPPWRSYEHPLTAATTAMLNISGGGADEQSSPMGLIYEYYKFQPLHTDAKEKLADIWTSAAAATPQIGGGGGGGGGGNIIPSQLKNANGLMGGTGLEIGAPPLSGGNQFAPDLQGLFINQHVGFPQPLVTTTQNFRIVKKEPEDLSSHHHHHHHHQHHRKNHCNSPNILTEQSTDNGCKTKHKVFLIPPGDKDKIVVDVNAVKNESRLPLDSPSQESRSVNATPTSSNSTSSLLTDHQNTTPIEFISSNGTKSNMYSTQIFATVNSTNGDNDALSPNAYTDHVQQFGPTGVIASSESLSGGGGGGGGGGGFSPSAMRRSTSAAVFAISNPYYKEYFATMASNGTGDGGANGDGGNGGGTDNSVANNDTIYANHPARLSSQSYTDDINTSSVLTSSFVERYVRQSFHNKSVISAATAAGLTVDLPSPDSGIGTDAITPREQSTLSQTYEYSDICPNSSLLDPLTASQKAGSSHSSASSTSTSRSRPWHDFGRQNDADKVQIAKIFSSVGFKYQLETPISTSQRREDDRITYINKGQFYGITLEYVPDPEKQLKSQTVKSIVMLMFREEKSPDDEIKAWQFWHGRQHSVKQRILDADTKNSVGLVGCIDEVAHNAIAIYWNPMESQAKINIAVQCLSTDFSSQKGVKGLPLHLQIDTYEDPRDTQIYHRGYCQIKVFCDKGAERKTRDEERRAAKRKMTTTSRKKLDELYHPACDRSEFYSMSDLAKLPVLFSPGEDVDKLASMELQSFYGHDADSSLNGHIDIKTTSPFLLHTAPKHNTTTPTLKFHNHFPPATDKKDFLEVSTADSHMFSPPLKKTRLTPSTPVNSSTPPLNERVMLYVRQEVDDVYTPLHVVPPTTAGLLTAIENKYKISASSINNLFRKNKKGIVAKIDDDMVAYYCNEDLFLLELKIVDEDLFDITFVELTEH